MNVPFEEIEERIKDIISHEVGNKKVTVKMVASALGMGYRSYMRSKTSEVVPVDELCFFCAKRDISINWMLYDQQTEIIKKETDKFIVKVR
ncbi:hypothetical protein JZU61_01745 [bacterium]|nr:hypothetical protein [bacterium]